MKASSRFYDVQIEASELILRKDGSMYHLAVLPEQVADTILIVGDPSRVAQISARFDTVEHRVGEREFHTHTGHLNGVRLSVVSTGIGVDNIDIVVNELDAARNIDLKTRRIKDVFRKMRFIRLGTSGTMQATISVGSFVASKYAIGVDGVPYFYQPEFEEAEIALMNKFSDEINWPAFAARPYAVKSSEALFDLLKEGCSEGITLTANGFYGPQGRSLRLGLQNNRLTEEMARFQFRDQSITNYEMECAGLYALGSMLGHEVCTVCTILANRATKAFASDPQEHVDALVDSVLAKITS